MTLRHWRATSGFVGRYQSKSKKREMSMLKGSVRRLRGECAVLAVGLVVFIVPINPSVLRCDMCSKKDLNPKNSFSARRVTYGGAFYTPQCFSPSSPAAGCFARGRKQAHFRVAGLPVEVATNASIAMLQTMPRQKTVKPMMAHHRRRVMVLFRSVSISSTMPRENRDVRGKKPITKITAAQRKRTGGSR